MRSFDKPLGMAVAKNRMALATRHDLWVFANSPVLAYEYLEEQPGRYDTLFLPRATYYIGDIHAHDVAISGERIIFAATRFSCLATLGLDYSFTPLWKPRFVSDLVPEDRCHLNGLAMLDGRPKYVTAPGDDGHGRRVAGKEGDRRRVDRRGQRRDRARRPVHAAFAPLARRANLAAELRRRPS